MEELSGALLEIPLADLVFYERCGAGTFGSVYRALWRPQNLIVAVKRLLVLEKEAQVLSLVSHKNIIKFHGASSKAPDYCLVTEYAQNGSLFAYLRQPDNMLDFKLIVKWATEIARGVHYLHWESPVKIIHRDLKSKNVVISADWSCKLCDFGASRFAVNTTKMTLAGTFPWMSPEAIQSLSVSEATDVWSYGVVLWELLTKEVPFNGIEGFQVAWLIVEKEQRLTIPTICPPSFRQLLEKCWKTDPKFRPNLKQILSRLHAMLGEESLPELTNSFLDHKMVWKKEIQATLDQLKKAEVAISNKEQELREREMKLKQREKSLVQQFNIVKLEDHDVGTWRDVDVYQWVMQLRKAGHTSDLAQYADQFLTNHITGRRLLLVTNKHLRDMGITSVGHCMDLLHEIEVLKTHNFRLLNFPPLGPKNTETITPLNVVTKETVSVMLIFGHHLRKGPTDEETKWKMFAEIDQDEDDDTTVLTLVKEVAFICKMPDFGTFTLTHPPFIMSTWCLGVTPEMSVECVVTYEPLVEKPKLTRVLYKVDGRCPMPKQQSVVLTLKRPTKASPVEEDPPSRASMPVSPAHTNASFSISSNVSQTKLSEAWTKTFHPVELPPSRSSSKADLWSGVVSGSKSSIFKPIPGTTEFINDSSKLSPSTSYSKALGRKSDVSLIDGPDYPNLTESQRHIRPTFTIGADSSISSSSGSVFSSLSRNTDSARSSGCNQNDNTRTQDSRNNLSPGNYNGGFKKPRPYSAGDKERRNDPGGRRRITYEQGGKPWPERQISQQTRSEPIKNRNEYAPNRNYRRAFSGGPTVYLTGGTGGRRHETLHENGCQSPRDQHDKGSPFFHQRQGSNQARFVRNNSREEKGKVHRGDGDYARQDKRQNQSNNYMNGHSNASRGNDQRGSRQNLGGKNLGNKNNMQLKIDNSNTQMTSNGTEEDGWTTVNSKHKIKT